ncbi:WD40 repeat [Dillenia turbinata]|uniref:WD40 repeat n=1 Tax=Dillenia turbinata TaxID=194707 RepID=A0AAN8Z6P3_9MAGN
MEVGMSFRDYSGRISSMDFHKASNYLVTASDDESIRLYDVTSAICLKTINSKKYRVELVCFTSHPTTVMYSSKNGRDESLRLLSSHDNKYLRYFKGHHDRYMLGLSSHVVAYQNFDNNIVLPIFIFTLGWFHLACASGMSVSFLALLIELFYCGIKELRNVRVHLRSLPPVEICLMQMFFKFSNDGGLMLLTTMNRHIHVLDSFCGRLIVMMKLRVIHIQPVESNLEASFSPEGMFVVSGSGDGSVCAWSVRRDKEVSSWLSTESDPPVIKLASGNLMFVTGSSELSFWIPDLSKLPAYVGRK